MPRIPRAFLSSLGFVAVLSCGESTGPAPIAGDFTLTSVNGSPPPQLVAATVACDQLIDSGSLTLTGARDFTLAGLVRQDCTRAGGSSDILPLSLVGTYTQNGGTLTFTLPGQGSLSAHFDGTTLDTTIPASPFTFPNDVHLVFTLQTAR
jgi:hypothetical protein